MLRHDFIAVSEEDLEKAINYHYYKFYNINVSFEKICFVPDSFILKNANVFKNINVDIQKIGRKTDSLDYWGTTIIPYETAIIIKDRIMENKKLRLHLLLNKKIINFLKLLQYAIDNKRYIVHHGI